MTERIPMGCEAEATCTLTRRLRTSHTMAVLRAFYCEAGGARCERRRRARAGEPVPPDLLPDGRMAPAAALDRDAA